MGDKRATFRYKATQTTNQNRHGRNIRKTAQRESHDRL
ncbi:Uncharacterised protein [Vibrio cholerae]|nr:Uncharacterised protein [Vibrio cholerae]